MAFDLYFGEQHEAIHHHEEYIFLLAEEAPGAFPLLESLWSRFYSEFNLTPEQSAALVHELLALHEGNGAQAGKAMPALVLRLAQFFSAAWRAKASVRCAGD